MSLWSAIFGSGPSQQSSASVVPRFVAREDLTKNDLGSSAKTHVHVVDLSLIVHSVELSKLPANDLEEKPEDGMVLVTVEDEEESSPAPRKSSLFKVKRPALALQERMQRALRRHSEGGAARLEALKQAHAEDVQASTQNMIDDDDDDDIRTLSTHSTSSPRSEEREGRDVTDADRPASMGRVSSLVKSYEELTKRALEEAAADEAALRDVQDVSDARAERRRRRSERLKARLDAASRGAVAKPILSNVSLSPLSITISIATETDAAQLVYSLDSGRTWQDYSQPVSLDKSVGKVVVLAYGHKYGMGKSDIASAVFTVEHPRFLRHAACPEELELAKYTDKNIANMTCSLCSVQCDEGSYVARHSDLAICASCALAPITSLDPRSDSLPAAIKRDSETESTATSYKKKRLLRYLGRARPKKATGGAQVVSIAVDVGRRRLWLSENVLFEGNTHAVAAGQSEDILQALAEVMVEHPSICIRIEGHTNSACGIECDGTIRCSNRVCYNYFSHSGGALAFSKRRADSVKDWLITNGLIEADRMETQGFAGSRRVVQDTESELNYLNRRVEVHMM